jgi:hypothetical protein
MLLIIVLQNVVTNARTAIDVIKKSHSKYDELRRKKYKLKSRKIHAREMDVRDREMEAKEGP